MIKPFLIISSVMLLLAVLPLPYGFHTLLRIVVTASASFAAYYFFKERDDSQSGIILALVALIFNPLIPIHLDKAIWMPIDIGTAIYMYLVSKKVS
jgi:hypothetical protein